jgi:hypothetical protein
MPAGGLAAERAGGPDHRLSGSIAERRRAMHKDWPQMAKELSGAIKEVRLARPM